MKIGIDAREIQNGVVTGIGRSLANFLEYFEAHDQKHVLFLFSEKPLPMRFSDKIGQVVIPSCPTFFWDQVKLPLAIKAHGIDFFYSPYYKAPMLTRTCTVNQVLDLMFLVFPLYRKKLGILGRYYYAIFGRVFARKSVSIITDSEHAKQDIIRLWRIEPEKIAVIPLGVGNRYSLACLIDMCFISVTSNLTKILSRS